MSSRVPKRRDAYRLTASDRFAASVGRDSESV